MSNIKFSPNLFLEVAELTRFHQFLDTDGFRKNLLLATDSYGIVREADEVYFTNFQVVAGNATQSVKIKSTTNSAIDSDGNVLALTTNDDIAIPLVDTWYWIIANYESSNIETGTVTVDINGNMTGVGTAFTDVLRGQPLYPARIKFPNATSNIDEYDIVSVIDDTNAVLSGTFTAETTMEYVVVGTFTPGHVPLAADKDIFNYDSTNIQILAEPVVAFDSTKYFNLARVMYSSGGQLTIQDKRTQFWKMRGQYLNEYLTSAPNVIIGAEAVRYQHASLPQAENIITVGWGLRTVNWSYETNTNTLTLLDAEGGKMHNLITTPDGACDGWRVYTQNGSVRKVVRSIKTGSQLTLSLDVLNVDDFVTGEEVYIVPDADTIEFRFIGNNNGNTNYPYIESIEKTVSFPIAGQKANVVVSNPTTSPTNDYIYNVLYRYKSGSTYGQWSQMPDANTGEGYFTEDSFDEYGVLYPLVSQQLILPYSTGTDLGYIEVNASTTHYDVTQTNNSKGITVNALGAAATTYTLTPGTSTKAQLFTGTGLTFTGNKVIAFSRTNAENGSEFEVIIDASFDVGVYTVSFQDLPTVGAGTTLYTLTKTDISYAGLLNKQFIIKASYTGTEWVFRIVEKDISLIGDIKMLGALTLSHFDGTGLGNTVGGHEGWAICNGQNGTPDMVGRFAVGLDSADTDFNVITGIGGSKTHTLTEAELPAHNHVLNDPGHVHVGVTADFDNLVRVAPIGSGSTSGSQDSTGEGSETDVRLSYPMDTATTGITMDNTGSGDGFSVLPPYTTVLYVMRVG